ncbi:zinc ribbon domain-containing protein [Methanobrevibacter sp.]|nr:zinc ribbon domain-containing protein [Methanobrevibacter sp.]MDO5859234.1 zinc ribbon domain-containing protein [Methanobrevibacter sp.]
MNFEDMNFCRSCAMPMTKDNYGSEKDGSKKRTTADIAIMKVNSK